MVNERFRANDKQETFLGKFVIKFRRRICNLEKSGWEISQIASVLPVHCRSAMAGKRGINTQPISMVTFEITTFEEERERVEMSG